MRLPVGPVSPTQRQHGEGFYPGAAAPADRETDRGGNVPGQVGRGVQTRGLQQGIETAPAQVRRLVGTGL